MNLALDLESTLATDELDRRTRGEADMERETAALLLLNQALSQSPKNFFGILARAVMQLTKAGSAGISLLNEADGRFVWPAVAGELKSLQGSGIPSDPSPCGTVLERRTSLLFIRPQRHFTNLESVHPPMEEVLLIPFFVEGKAVGTIWAVSHDEAFHFCGEDRALLESLSGFASSAYLVLRNSGALQPLLEMQPPRPGNHETYR